MKLFRQAASAALATLVGVLLLAGSAPATLAQSEPGSGAEMSKKEQREAARQERIAEYLRKREERRARKEAEAERQAAGSADAGVATAAASGELAPGESALPRDVQRMQDQLRQTDLGRSASVSRMFDRIERGEADENELAALGNFLSDAGLNREALAYYGLALGLDDRDPLLWNNVGTIHRKLGESGKAVSAFSRALSLDGNYALAHYNLGASLDDKGDYEAAVAEYRIALTLDPSLGDPLVNPQAANNPRLTTVKLMLYRESYGALGLPLQNPPGGPLEADR